MKAMKDMKGHEGLLRTTLPMIFMRLHAFMIFMSSGL